MTAACRAIAAALLAAAATGRWFPSHAQEMVWDPAEIAHLAETSAEMAETLSRAVELLDRINELSRTVGRSAALSALGFTHFDVLRDLQGASLQAGGLAPRIGRLTSAGTPDVDDVVGVVRALVTIPPGGARATDAAQATRAVDALYRQAAEDGFTLSMEVRTSLSLAPERARLLVAQASAASDAREDVAADTAAALAVLEQLASVKAMLALILEIQATSALRRQIPLEFSNP